MWAPVTMWAPVEATPTVTRLQGLVFVNFTENDRDPKTKISLINTHCSAISRRQRRPSLSDGTNTTKKGKSRKNAAAALGPRTLKIRSNSLLKLSDKDANDWNEHHDAHRPKLSHSGRRQTNRSTDVESSIGIGSPPTNAFRLIPIEGQALIPMAFEFWLNVYASIIAKSTARLPIGAKYLLSGFHTCMQVTLQDPMLFEQTMALSLVMRSMHEDIAMRTTAVSIYHSNRSLRQLRERLKSDIEGESTSDAVIMTITLLATTTFHICREYDSISEYIQALAHIIAHRGGYEKLGWSGFLALRAKQAYNGLSATRNRTRPESVVLVYPIHPFSPVLCQKISTLPLGFRELALRGSFSIQFIDLLHETMPLLDRTPDQGDNAAVKAFGTLGHYCWEASRDEVAENPKPKLTPIGRVLAFTLLAYCHYLMGNTVPSIEIGLQAHLRTFHRDREFYIVGESEENALDWSALILCATTEKASDAWTWATKILYTTKMMSEDRQKQLEKAFFQVPKSLSSELEIVAHRNEER